MQFFPDKMSYQQGELTCMPPSGEDGTLNQKLMFANSERHRYEYMAQRALEEAGLCA